MEINEIVRSKLKRINAMLPRYSFGKFTIVEENEKCYVVFQKNKISSMFSNNQDLNIFLSGVECILKCLEENEKTMLYINMEKL